MRVKNITVSYGEKAVLNDFSYDFSEGKITCILGPSGCGKTTLLNVVADIIPYQGEVERPKKIAFVFQDPTLFSHLTIEQNIDLVLKGDVKDKEKRKIIISDVLDKVGLLSERKAFPDTLSGGMAQRVSLARAFAYESGLLLMDEPFKGLDISLKKKIMDVFVSLYEASKPTTIFVTHDVDEAIQLGNKILVLDKKGEIVLEKDVDEAIGKRDAVTYAPLRAEIYGAIE